MQLKEEIAEFWDCKTLIYSSGWLAGYGTMKSLIKDYDHIIIDEFADNSFFEGAYAATKNVTRSRHLDEAHIEQILGEIRAKDKENGIFVVTEAIFPMDSSSPNLVNIQRMAKQHNAFVAIGCGHDFGVVGEKGQGVWEEQGLADRSNVVFVGTGSKTTSINFGFVGCTHFAVPEYMKYYSAAYMFTNAINPVQANAALATLRVIRSQEGLLLRQQLIENCNYLRSKLQQKGHTPLGRTSGFVCVRVGDEIISRIIVRILMDNGSFQYI
jgi:glycine C-acetyltransferase